MAATKYQVFCRYLHPRTNKAILNDLHCEWHPAPQHPYFNKPDSCQEVITYDRTGRATDVYEHMWIRPEDDCWVDTSVFERADVIANLKKNATNLDTRFNDLIQDSNQLSNPKYDMLFYFDGVETMDGETNRRNRQPVTKGGTPYYQTKLFYQKMKRLDMCPWVLYATVASLTVVLEKANEIVNIMGVENVLVGKVVALEQYIEIV